MNNKKFALVIPLANESDTFDIFSSMLIEVFDRVEADNSFLGNAYLVVDNVSKDNTFELCQELHERDSRFIPVWAPENRNVVDAYIRGYKEALKSDEYKYVMEMDGGMSHDPNAIPMFLRYLSEGHKCVFGCRFVNGGSIYDSNWRRTLFSRGGTILSNFLLGTHFRDMTSGYMGFHADVARKFVEYGLLSKAHFYQTEVRYLLRDQRYIEAPIHYMAPSPSVSKKAVKNSFAVLFYYFLQRLRGNKCKL
jgi:dolichol-phosphate mannosyltransferase